jgi:hypothetical protein
MKEFFLYLLVFGAYVGLSMFIIYFKRRINKAKRLETTVLLPIFFGFLLGATLLISAIK